MVLVNAHWNNRGDEAALCALIDSIYSINADIVLSVIFKEVERAEDILLDVSCMATRYRPTEAQVFQTITLGKCDNREMIREMHIIKEADLIIYAPGGAVISDRFWWEKQLEYIFPIVYAQSIGKSVVFASPSIGPFSDEYTMRNNMFNGVNSICLRESISVTCLKKILKENDNIFLSNDLAFLGRVNIDKERKKAQKDFDLCHFLDKYKTIIGITITDLTWNVGYLNDNDMSERISHSFKEFIRWFGSQRIGVILIPQLFGEQNDEVYLRKYVDQNTFVLSSEYDNSFQQYLISQVYAVIGLRYHSNIFAAKMGTPMIPIIYEQKMKGFLRDSQIEDWGIDIKDISFTKLKDSFEKLRGEYCERRNVLERMRNEWIRRSQITIDIISKHVDLYYA